MNLAFPTVGTTPKPPPAKGTRPPLPPMTDEEKADLLDRLADLRERLNDGHVGRMQMAHDKARYQRWTNRWHERVIEYLGLLSAAKDVWGRDALIQRRESILDRLERGWFLEPTDTLPDEKIGKRFHNLLIEYEALSDLIQGFVYVHDDMSTRDRMAGYRREKHEAVEAKREARQAVMIAESKTSNGNGPKHYA